MEAVLLLGEIKDTGCLINMVSWALTFKGNELRSRNDWNITQPITAAGRSVNVTLSIEELTSDASDYC